MSLTGKTMKYTNGEFVETVHSTLRKFEEVHCKKTVRKMGTPIHVQRSLQTLSTFNSARAGFTPPSEMTIRKSNTKIYSPKLVVVIKINLYLSDPTIS